MINDVIEESQDNTPGSSLIRWLEIMRSFVSTSQHVMSVTQNNGFGEAVENSIEKWWDIVLGNPKYVSNGKELIHLTGRHVNKASATSTCCSGLLWVFVRSIAFDSHALSGCQHPRLHLVEWSFAMGWLCVKCAFIRVPGMHSFFGRSMQSDPGGVAQRMGHPLANCHEPLAAFGAVSGQLRL